MATQVTLRLAGRKVSGELPLPAALSGTTRGIATTSSWLGADVVRVKQVFDLSRASRAASVAAAAEPLCSDEIESSEVLAIETESGDTLFISGERLAASARQRGAEDQGAINLDALQPVDPARRGLGDWLWKKVSVLEIRPDGLMEAAERKALELAREWLGQEAVDWVIDGTTWIGARAVAWAVESRLLQKPGLYRWVGAEGAATDLAAVTTDQLRREAEDGAILVLIHGTGSNTAGSFADLRKAAGAWAPLAQRFGGRIYAFEHCTLSESPVENALALAKALPAGVRLNLLTHSRGGLVGDLLCLGDLQDVQIDRWQRRAGPGVKRPDELEQVTERERQLLRQLREVLRLKGFQVERYARVACPARGTLLASANLDVFLSSLVSVVGMVPALKVSGVYEGLTRWVLEVVKRRMDPQVIPGIEAMLPDGPLAELLSRAQRKPGTQMAVVAGDIEGGSLWQRLAVVFTDWAFFDQLDNDLVVDTASMYEGLARDGDAHALFDQGARVNHFRYFENLRTSSAVSGWVTGEPAESAGFDVLPGRGTRSVGESAIRRLRGARPRQPDGTRPIVLFLPGIMGSHLELKRPDQEVGKGNRLWFDLVSLSAGGFSKLRWEGQPAGRTIEPEGLFEMFYGDLCDHLEKSHDVVRFAYDWREPIEDEADRLGNVLAGALDLAEAHRQPVRLMAHSMGGLVCRAMIQRHGEIWKRMTANPDGRFVMLGTPNHGSHLLVQHLIGKAGTTRLLAKLDLHHDLQEILDIVVTLPGALQLLPKPGFRDTAEEQEDSYFKAEVWKGYRAKLFDRWFGDGVVGQPSGEALAKAERLWTAVLTENVAPEPVSQVAYVFGVDDSTACGIRKEKDDRGRDIVRPLVTPAGDGSVTWKSGRLSNLPPERHWWMEASHGDLTRKKEAFDELTEILVTGETSRPSNEGFLKRGIPVTRAVASTKAVPYEAGPPVPPNEDELAMGLMGTRGRVTRAGRAAATRLTVSVTAGDLRFAHHPVLCGHYPGDPIAGPERILDCDVVRGGLRKRERLGFYPNDIGTAAVVLLPESEPRRAIDIRRGAVVVGLGEFGKLTATALTETVRAGVLQFLMVTWDREGNHTNPSEGSERSLVSLLIGYNSTTNISIDDSIAAVVRGVVSANRQFAEVMGSSRWRVSRLEFMELYLDTAISAAHALQRLPQRLQKELAKERVRLDIDRRMKTATGARPRLADAGGGAGYWPKLLVTGGDPGHGAPGDSQRGQAGSTDSGDGDHGSPRVARTLRYLYLAERARAETEVHHLQPGLIEGLVEQAIRQPNYESDLARIFFELMVPLEFKETARQTSRLVLVVDRYTANFPWEMLAIDEVPLVTRTRLVRQLASQTYRRQVRRTTEPTALVIGNPSTQGFSKVFTLGNLPEDEGLEDLTGAEQEAESVSQLLRSSGYRVEARLGEAVGTRDVLGALVLMPYQIIHIAAHGLFDVRGRDGERRTGVVLSDGLMLTAEEIRQLQVVPELVFLNCCHLGSAQFLPATTGRLAYGLAQELIEMGVRCVVAAGWEVEDGAAQLFAKTLYQKLLDEGLAFGDAVYEARVKVHEEYPTRNTWGAYQAYGDPAFHLRRLDGDRGGSAGGKAWSWVSPSELEAAIDGLAVEAGFRTRPEDKAALAGTHATVSAARADLEALLRKAESEASDFLGLPGIQVALGRLYGELGDFGAARDAYGAALSAPIDTWDLPIKAVEQLANLEARQGGGAEDRGLVETALQRLEWLLGLQPNRQIQAAVRKTPERLALYGSACKRMARIEARAQHPDAVKSWLVRARDAYGAGEGELGAPDFSPYHALNRLQLEVVLGEHETAESKARASDIAEKAGKLAAQDFTNSPDFFKAIMPVDAAYTIALINRQEETKSPELARQYGAVASQFPSSLRELDSAAAHIELLGECLRALRRPSKGTDLLAARLRQLAGQLQASKQGTQGTERVQQATEPIMIGRDDLRVEALREPPSAYGRPGEPTTISPGKQIRRPLRQQSESDPSLPASSTDAARFAIVIPQVRQNLPGRARRGAARSGPGRSEVLSARRKGLEEFAKRHMGYHSVRLDGPARGKRRAVPAEEPSGIKFLEGVGAIIVDRNQVDLEQVLATGAATVIENDIVSLSPRLGQSPVVSPSPKDFWHLQMLQVANAREKGLDGRGVCVGVLDSGIAADHPEFEGRIVYFAEFDDAGEIVSQEPRDAASHGTHVCGLIAGRRAGVAPGVALAVAAVLTKGSPGGPVEGTLTQVLAGLNWLATAEFPGRADPGADVVNASLTIEPYHSAFYGLIELMKGDGIAVIAAIGNSGEKGKGEHGSPGNYDIVLGIGAADRSRRVTKFSAWGGVSEHPGLNKPDFCAPGEEVLSAVPPDGYAPMSGTSMASPLVTASAALLMNRDHRLKGQPDRLFKELNGLVRVFPKRAARRLRGGVGILDLSRI